MSAPPAPRILIAGFGNELRGDDGFGVEVIRRLEREPLPDGVTLLEVGIGGIHLAQELLTPYDRVIVVDATSRGGAPGALYTLAIDAVDVVAEVDLHAAVPARALGIARALGTLPPVVHLVGCEPAQVDELLTGLSPAVEAAVEPAVRRIRQLLQGDGTR